MNKAIVFAMTFVAYFAAYITKDTKIWILYGIAWLLTVICVTTIISGAIDVMFGSLSNDKRYK